MKPEQCLDEPQLKLLKWAEGASQLIGRAFDECSTRFAPSSFQNDRECLVLWQLNGSCHTTAESALILIGSVRLWDADVLVRSVTEGTLKFIFLTVGSPTERQAKMGEFDDAFGAIGQIKRHQRLKEFLSVVDNPNADEWRPFRDLLLSEERIQELQKQFPKNLRQQLNQKWSFAEISASLHRSGSIYGLFAHMLYNYGMSSHVAHQDIDGIGMVWDRNGRGEVRRKAVELAHGARMIGDIIIMTLLRVRALFVLLKIDTAILEPLFEAYESIQKETATAHKHFHEVEYLDEGGNQL